MTLEEFFLVGFFKKVTVNMTSYSDLEKEEGKGSDRQENPPRPRVEDKILIVLETLLTRMDWR